MPNRETTVGSAWALLTTTDVAGLMTVQMRPRRDGAAGRLFLARGTSSQPPPSGAGLFMDPRETTGAGGITLDSIDPGGAGDRLWARFKGDDPTCPVWLSWQS